MTDPILGKKLALDADLLVSGCRRHSFGGKQ